MRAGKRCTAARRSRKTTPADFMFLIDFVVHWCSSYCGLIGRITLMAHFDSEYPSTNAMM